MAVSQAGPFVPRQTRLPGPALPLTTKATTGAATAAVAVMPRGGAGNAKLAAVPVTLAKLVISRFVPFTQVKGVIVVVPLKISARLVPLRAR